MLKNFLLVSLLFLNINFFPEKDIPLSAESAILMGPLTKRLIYSKNPRQRLSPASTAKIMTALVVLKKSNLKKKVKVSKLATTMEPSKVYLKEGELYLTEDLLKAILLSSGNDASAALAESVAGSEEKFAELMNRMAKAIGAKDTNFRNSNGLPAEGQYSTAYDLALIVREAMKNRVFTDIMKMKHSEIQELTTGRRIKLKNHNKTLWNEESYVILGKTGYTRKAGHCFAGYVRYNRWQKMIVVMLKSKNMWPDVKELAEPG
jgi:D-alanyl-D-alanine carboxypeptidase